MGDDLAPEDVSGSRRPADTMTAPVERPASIMPGRPWSSARLSPSVCRDDF